MKLKARHSPRWRRDHVGVGRLLGRPAGPAGRQADHPRRLPDLPQRRPDRQEQQVAGRGAARLQHQVDQVRLRRRRQHRVHRQGTRLRRAGIQPGRPRIVGAAEHSVQGRVRARRRRRQRGAGGPQRHRHQHHPAAEGQADRHPVRLDGALQPAGRAVAERLVPQRCSAGRPAAAGDPGGMGPR